MKQYTAIFLFLLTLSIGYIDAAPKTDLPVIITAAKTDKQDKLVLFISGDGGWNSFSQKLAENYAESGFNVIGLNSFKYFWKKKTPQQAADDIVGLLETYGNQWHKQKIVICGFSFGADVTPFIYSHLPEKFKSRICLIQLISPSAYTDFEIHMMDMLRSGNTVRAMNIAAEVNLIDVTVICYYGQQETEKPLISLKKANIKMVVLAGDHHYENSYAEIIKNAL